MVRHIVLYTIKDEFKESIPDLVKAFFSFKGVIPGLIEVESGKDELKSERSYDMSLVMLFDSWDSFKAYQTHPAHLPVKANMHKMRDKSVSCDYEIG